VKIADNVFVVTGAGNGMGREVVLGLARRGAQVAAVDLDELERFSPKRTTGFVAKQMKSVL